MKVRKVILVIAILITSCLLLTGCCSSNTDDQNTTQTTSQIALPSVSTFKVISSEKILDTATQYILYDPETLTMYSLFLYSHQRAAEAGLAITPMYNPDGTLRLYNPYGNLEFR